MNRKRIENREDLEKLINTFYSKVKLDDLIGPIFNRVLADHWDEHLKKIQNFWDTLLFGAENYNGRPFPPHIPLGLKPEHFKRWLEIFFDTVDEYFEGQKADEIKMRAFNMGRNFLTNIQHLERQKRSSED